jgi:hypothetical protein
MLTRLYLVFAIAAAAGAQQVVAPTPAQVGSPRGDNTGNYNITQSFELGYRWNVVGGNLGMYRSVDNYGNGIRLLGSNLTVNSRDGHGNLFDEILLNTMGLGNDPYESAMLRVQKNKLYRYDLLWRSQAYYNPGLTIAGSNALNGSPAVSSVSNSALLSTGGLHIRDTQRRMQDHDLTLLPQSKVRFRLGYSRNVEDGPALSTVQLFDTNGPGLPVFADVHRQWNEYRLGTDVDLAGFRLTVTRRWDFFKEDTPYTFAGLVGTTTLNDQTALKQYNRSEPIHGANPGWLGNLFTRRKVWGVNARLTYTAGSRDYILNEAAFGTSQFGGAGNRQILVGGNANRPDLAGDFALSFYPTEKITIVNNTSILSNRIDGASSFSDVQNGNAFGTTVFFRYLAIRTVTNTTDVQYRLSRIFGVYAQYGYSDRLIRRSEASADPSQFAQSYINDIYSVSNHMNTGRVGFRVRPWKPFTLNLDGEIGRSNFPLTPVSEKRYHSINGRAEYRTKRAQLSTSYRQMYNLNAPFVFSTYLSHDRQYSSSASWAPRDAISFDASYTKMHLDTRGGIAFFTLNGARPTLSSQSPSYYTSNLHAANLGVRFAWRRRAELFAGYTITKDTGGAHGLPTTGVVQSLLTSVEAFPLTYQSPMGRVSVRITPKIRWNAGWQFYDYAEDVHLFGYNQNYRAHTGFTSVLWSF